MESNETEVVPSNEKTVIFSFETADEKEDFVVSGVASRLKAMGYEVWWELGDGTVDETPHKQYYRKNRKTNNWKVERRCVFDFWDSRCLPDQILRG